eukprot:5032901-Pyramimonas_sp.AAC.1
MPRQPREERGVGLEVVVQLLVDLQHQRPDLPPRRLDGSLGPAVRLAAVPLRLPREDRLTDA